MKKEKVASMIDHTLLSQTAGIRDVMRLCNEAKKYKFCSVCVNPYFVAACKNELSGSNVKVCTVIGFPLGQTTTQCKIYEAVNAIHNGADEIDMVINVGSARECRFNDIELDIKAVCDACREAGNVLNKKIIVKVILETCFLDDATIVTCCQCAKKAGADFVKTSTGFAVPKGLDGQLLPNGASNHHVEVMRKAVGKDFGVKASGGIRSARACAGLLSSGANRIGTSSGIQIIETWDESVKIKGYDD